MADYDAQLKKLYAKYQLAIGKLTELLEVRIANPVNCMTEVMAKLAIPKKYQAEALELFKAQYNVWSCTAHDIYFAISEILFILRMTNALYLLQQRKIHRNGREGGIYYISPSLNGRSKKNE